MEQAEIQAELEATVEAIIRQAQTIRAESHRICELAKEAQDTAARIAGVPVGHTKRPAQRYS